MRAILNTGLQFFLAITVLIYISDNQSAPTTSVGSNTISKNEHQFIVNQIQSTTQLIQLAEVGEESGNLNTLLKASSLKDNQIAVLYHWMDLAENKENNKGRIPPLRNSGDLVNKVYCQSGNFDEKWNKVVDHQTQSIVDTLGAYSVKADQQINATIANVLSTIDSQIKITSGNIMIAGN